MRRGLDRRQVLRLIAAGAAASVAACSRPDDTLYPYVDEPDGTVPGAIRRYATALPFSGYGRGVTGLVADTRPIKLEGLAGHPASLGATDLFVETAILDLYDPQRMKAVGGPEGAGSWPQLTRAVFERTAPRRGQGMALLTGRVTSPTLLARIAALKTVYPGLQHVRWEPIHDDAAMAAARAAWGRPLVTRPRLAEADVVVTLGADPLGPGPEQIANARAWSQRRRGKPMPRMYAAEPSLTATGAMADRRVSANPRELALLCHALAGALGASGVATEDLPPAFARWAADAARDLRAAKGRAVVLAGEGQPAAVHGFAAWANGVLAAPVDHLPPVDPDPRPHGESLAALAAAMHAGAVDTLVVLDANPVYAAPPALRFGEAMKRVPLTVALTRFPDETSALSQWAAPIAHPLEGWHDWRWIDGTASIAQPLVRPFYDSRTPAEALDLLGNPASGASSLQRVRESWARLDDAAWRQAVASGVVPNSAATPVTVGAAPLVLPEVPAAGGMTLELRPSPTLWDGRYATNAWAQECPDPLTKEVWGASARINPTDMVRLGLADGDLVRIARGGEAIELAARGEAGQAQGVVTALAGYGRAGSGAVADGLGANGWTLSGTGALTVERGDGRAPVLTTQHVFALEGELDKLFPVLGPEGVMPRPDPQASLVRPNPAARDNAPPQWAMAIDSDVCIGCNACVVACQAENNVPAIGPHEISVGRDMHWLRVDRYDHADTTGFQPVPCMQCEKAPCEPVCPVEASVHNHEGLNLQVYNRCVGTRTCQANCPYKVRRFNFLDYAERSLWGDAEDASVTAQRNPDVTVRARGVMEKCTYCVHRIAKAEHDADAGEGAGVGSGQVVTACQAACPTSAITFGTLDSGDIQAARADPRHFALLEELGTKPRTTYLARRRNGGEA